MLRSRSGVVLSKFVASTTLIQKHLVSDILLCTINVYKILSAAMDVGISSRPSKTDFTTSTILAGRAPLMKCYLVLSSNISSKLRTDLPRTVADSAQSALSVHSCAACETPSFALANTIAVGHFNWVMVLSCAVSVLAPMPLSPQARRTQSTASGQNFPGSRWRMRDDSISRPFVLAISRACAMICKAILSKPWSSWCIRQKTSFVFDCMLQLPTGPDWMFVAVVYPPAE
jgi:hypothetical protein